MKNKFDIVSDDAFYSNAGGAICYQKCQTLYGEAKKQACAIQYPSILCAWDCSRHPDKPCCKHNRKATENKENCRKNIDTKRSSCQSDCDAKAGAGAYEDVVVDIPPTTITKPIPAKKEVPSTNNASRGIFSDMTPAMKWAIAGGSVVIIGLALTLVVQMTKTSNG